MDIGKISRVVGQQGQVTKQGGGGNNRIAEGAFTLLPEPDGFLNDRRRNILDCCYPKKRLKVFFLSRIQPVKA